ncbi:MAG: DMT family transporter [Candidatus Thiodiazotropha lotti]|uniref:DMT family transporter n=1 Tax=Candidatus Thiodiazotropha lotti TaxID=2792787 RepID=A0A9E4MZU4_9GAMM|nr:DMT family transporter [Candidatus Thiodiazotropha lotti]MCG7938568.1 DMT family transporter [Candidatus Thiodiazotropha lotti]MCW4203040.1 DMT family transporter [Candidatus Thiodiazotropha lotti]
MPQTVPPPEAKVQHLFWGIISTILACFLLAIMDGLGKWLMGDLPMPEVVWARYFFHTLIVAILFSSRSGFTFVRANRPGIQLIRAICLMGVTLSLYSAIQTISLADATSIVFFAPVLVTLLAGWFLKEKVGATEWSAVGIGFIGVLLIVRPGFRDPDPALLLACLAAVCLAFYFVLTRALKGHDSEQTTLFHTTFAGAVILTLSLPIWWQQPSPIQWVYLVVTGALGASGHFLLVKAFHMASASLLSPYLNAQIVAAALISVIFFDDLLDWPFYVGSVLIVGAGLMIWLHQRLLASLSARNSR